MEEVKEVSQVVTKKNFSANKPEDASSQFPSIMIEENLGSKKGGNEGFESLRLRWPTKKSGAAVSMLSIVLGGNAVEQRHAIQSFNKDVITLLDLKVGDNLNEKFQAQGLPAARLAISEIVQSEYDNLEDSAQIGYSAKINPSSGEVIGKGGEQIYRKVYFTDLTTPDEYVQSDGKAVTIQPEVTQEAEDDLPS